MARLARSCPRCAAEVDIGWVSCPFCAASLPTSNSEMPTVAMQPQPERSSTSSDEGRFPAGTVLGERYRIINLLGSGGMGEVYRAFDIKLEQQVALKFLPAAMARDSRLLERFRGEVRVARQISHRNVCRVYDLSEIDGSPFISMEYVDGEDLGSLLRRIGRLPGDKAIEFARRLCAGLAAAHEKGILHRDLKPANVMIDGRGQVVIMDFGLAAVADAVAGGDIRSGTPAYMAPEQREGREVTVRSDVYSLGLVLAEMFTGQKSRDGKLSAIVKDIDPAVERAIERCLDVNPSRRLQSALDVARALPGGDPLAEALAAGDTPSPEMVAASEDTGALSVRTAVACLGVVVAGLAALVFWGSRYSMVNVTPMPYSPDVLRQKTHELAARLGYSVTPVDESHAFDINADYAAWARRTLKPAQYRDQLARQEPSTIRFRHTDSPQYMAPKSATGMVSSDDPPRAPGTIDTELDPQGRLVFLRVMAGRQAETAAQPLDWNQLFEAAGLDPSRWTAAEPREIPPTAFDQRQAWTGTYSGEPATPLRIEAAAWKGRAVYFEIFGPWRQERSVAVDFGPLGTPAPLAAIVVLAGFFLALRNFRAGRGDSGNALRLACFVLVCSFLSAVATFHHTPTAGELQGLFDPLGRSLLLAAVVWILYIALEPYVRRHWPQALIGWTRALSGKLRDPLVAGHLLAGIAAGVSLGVVFDAASVLTMNIPTQVPALETSEMVSNWFGGLATPPTLGLGVFFLFVLMRLIFRRTWLALGAVLVGLLALAGSRGLPIVLWLQVVIAFAIYVTVAIRYGMLALTAAITTVVIRARYPLTSNFSSWYAPQCWITVALVIGLTLWCFRNALGGRKLWKGDFLES